MTSPKGAIATDTGRWYERNGRQYLSVTNAIGQAVGKPAIVPWSNNLTAKMADETMQYVLEHGELPPLPPAETVAEKRSKNKTVKDWPTYWKREHTKVKEAAGVRGDLFHDWAEAYMLGQRPDVPELPEEIHDRHGTTLALECAGFVKTVEKYGIEPWGTEATVYSDQYGYAGTGDLWAYITKPPSWWPDEAKEGLWCMDHKTSRGVWPETALQLAAYRHGDFIGLPDGTDHPVPPTIGGAVLHVTSQGTELVPYRCGAEEFHAFVGCVQSAFWQSTQSADVVNWNGVVSE